MKIKIGEESSNKSSGSDIRIQLAYIRDNLPYSVVFSHYGLDWRTDSTHQTSCPFHGVDRNPSARYYEDSKKFYCFACSEGGDVSWFIKKKEELKTWVDTVQFIQNTFGVGMDSSDLRKRIELEKAVVTANQHGKRNIISVLYTNKVNDALYKTRGLNQRASDIVDALTQKLFKRKAEIDKQVTGYLHYVALIRHWHSWCISSLAQAVRSMTDD